MRAAGSVTAVLGIQGTEDCRLIDALSHPRQELRDMDAGHLGWYGGIGSTCGTSRFGVPCLQLASSSGQPE